MNVYLYFRTHTSMRTPAWPVVSRAVIFTSAHRQNRTFVRAAFERQEDLARPAIACGPGRIAMPLAGDSIAYP